MGVAAAVQAGLAVEPLGGDPEVAGGMRTQIGHRVRQAACAGGEGPRCQDGQEGLLFGLITFRCFHRFIIK